MAVRSHSRRKQRWLFLASGEWRCRKRPVSGTLGTRMPPKIHRVHRSISSDLMTICNDRACRRLGWSDPLRVQAWSPRRSLKYDEISRIKMIGEFARYAQDPPSINACERRWRPTTYRVNQAGLPQDQSVRAMGAIQISTC